MSVNRSHIALVLLLVLAFLIRMGYILEIKDAPHTLAPSVDAAYHHQWANRVASGDPGDLPFFRAPLYPIILGGIYILFGDGPLPSRILQVILSTMTVWILWSLGRRLFGATVGWISGIVYAFYGLSIYFTGELLITTLIVFLNIVILWLLVKYSSNGTFWQWGLIGLMMGLSAIARPNILIVLPVVIVALWFANKQLSVDRSTRNLIAVCLGLIIPILPVTLANRIGGGEWVLIATQGGVNFYIGNNPEATGAHAVLPPFGETWELHDAKYLAEQEVGRILTPGQVSSYFFKKGLRWISNHPIGWLWLTIKKTHLFFNAFEISNNRNIYFFSSQSRILSRLLWLGFGLIAPLGILGAITIYKNNKKARIVTWIIMCYSIGVILFFITARYRMPIVPLMILFSSALIVQLFDWIRTKNLAKSGTVIMGGIFLYFLCWWNPYGFSNEADAQTYFSLGNAYLKLDRYSQARDEYQHALALDPNYQQVHLNMGVSFYRQGNFEEAENEYQRELSLHPESIMAMNNLGALALHQGENEEASHWFRKALSIKPYYNDATVNLAESLFRQGYSLAQSKKFSEAIVLFQEAVDLAPSRSMYRYNLSVVLAATGQADQAKQQWETAYTIDPSIPPLPNYVPVDSSLDTTP